MRKWKGWLLIALAWAAGPVWAQAQGADAQGVDLAPYLRKDGYERIKISPDGKHYAATVPLEDRTVLIIMRRADKKVITKATGVKDSMVADFWWANDERVVIAMAQQLGSRDDTPYRTGELYGLGIGGERAKVLVGYEDDPGLVDTYGNVGNRDYADFIGRMPGDPRSVLIAVSDFSANPQTRVEKLDVYTGRRTVVTIAPVRRADFVADGKGEVRLAEGAGDDNYFKLYYRENDDADWTLVNDQKASGHYESPLGFSADGVTAYLQVSHQQGPDSIVAWNTRSGERKEMLRDPDVDPYSLLRDRDGTLVGAHYMSAGVRSRFFDENSEIALTYRRLERAFSGSAVSITSFAGDGIAMLQIWNDRMQGDYYLYDMKTRNANGVFAQQEWFNPEVMPLTREVTLQARDGTSLRGYLTLPRKAPQQPLPMVVMPHGGPFGIFDRWQFDTDTQLLAEAGYTVLRINYRGSGNYGRTFRVAGAGEWGGTMQDDLTDATRWAVAERIADGERICIYGGSYGGYAALMGVAKEPGLYRCAVGYVGVYDLEAMHRDNSRKARWVRNWSDEWVGQRDGLDARSPTTMANRIKAPVFLAAGGQDQRAPIEHSKKMERALRDAGVPVETLYYSSEGHGFYTEPHRREFYTKLLDFLARNIGGARAKAGAEVQGTQ
ncbi:alpha/beta hydrolase family protein [Lysobacter niastensis]|uniref:S9 family peptidase n=1 Tax=Lysobacter niastensis TaxID=380629 RepID=A0ABS0B534_9GAMM|nr:prolyl oligopeptidase family serine peptidase [Lysobacter niastensis]MBF6023878.1 S9 family peptidase [Lysobacter niastensis]